MRMDSLVASSRLDTYFLVLALRSPWSPRGSRSSQLSQASGARCSHSSVSVHSCEVYHSPIQIVTSWKMENLRTVVKYDRLRSDCDYYKLCIIFLSDHWSMFLFNSLFNSGVKQKTSYVTVTVMSDNHDNYSSDMKFWSNLMGKSFLFVTGKDSQCISKLGFIS